MPFEIDHKANELKAIGVATDITVKITPKGTGSLDVDTSKIINVTDPTSNQDAATKKYVDDNAGMSNPMTTADDIIVAGASGTPTRLGGGTDDEVLTMVSGVPAWAAAGGGGEEFFVENFDGAVGTATGAGAIMIGEGTAGGEDSICIGGLAASAPDANDIAIGRQAIANGGGTGAIVIGNFAGGTTLGLGISIGPSAGSKAGCVAIGKNARADGANGCVSIGQGADAGGDKSVAVGGSTVSVTFASGAGSIALGHAARSTNTDAIAIGRFADASGDKSIAIGGDSTDASSADATGTTSIAIGRNSLSASTNSVSIGTDAAAPLNGLSIRVNSTTEMEMTSVGVVSIKGAAATAGQWVLPPYTVAGVPTGTSGGMIFVTDETGGAIPAFYDGTNWRRVTDRAIVA